MSAKQKGIKILAQNKQARRNYDLLEFVEAGLVLTGSEVKSIRDGRVSFKDGYVSFHQGEAYLTGVHVATYENAGYAQHEPERERKLLLHKREIASLASKVEQKGLTVVPTKMYLKNGLVKVELALGKGRKLHDQREALKRKAVQRDTEREMSRYK